MAVCPRALGQEDITLCVLNLRIIRAISFAVSFIYERDKSDHVVACLC